MKRLYFVRHGESTINTGMIWGSQQNGPLTELGREQARAAGQRAKQDGLQFDMIVSSPVQRAKETAKIIAKEVGYPLNKIRYNQLFRERFFGELEGTSYDGYFEKHSYEEIDRVPGAETIAQLHDRAEKAHVYLRSLPADNILVVSHSAFGRALRRVINARPHTDEYIKRVALPHAEILVWIEED